jgi:chromosomal replication initiation ATPase DnaA
MAILLKQFDDRQITISPEFITFVSKRINRTYDSICKFVDRIDLLALEQKREVTIPVARKILDSLKEGNVQRADNSLDSSLFGGS